MGSERSENVFQTLEDIPWESTRWWLSIVRCKICSQQWLLANETRINDVSFLKRLTEKESEKIRFLELVPKDFNDYEFLLKLGRERGLSVRFCDPCDPIESPSLFWTVVDLAKARPGIHLTELKELLSLDLDLAQFLALKAIGEECVTISFD
ncbi:MAG TPA: hypothetical protein VGP47_08910 [Parachlamydiaceae bacterium]|nr:hypothetical protein [Parachlamydiaceae bacterium]